MMKTHDLHWQAGLDSRQNRAKRAKLDLPTAANALLLILVALLPLVLLPMTTIWFINAGLLDYVAASFWAFGFTYLALAVDASGQRLVLLLVSGLATTGLACAGSRLAPEFATLAAVLAAAWLAAPAVRRLLAPTEIPDSAQI